MNGELDLSKIKQVPLRESEYLKEATTKTQIVLHHTAGNSSGVNVVKDWDTDARGRIATCVVISGKGAANSPDGEIVQCFSSKFWAYHLGVKKEVFEAYNLPQKNLDKLSIGIEICNWGQLTLKNGKYYNYVNREVPASEVTTLDTPYKGYKYFHKYSDAQIESVRQLLTYWKDLYNINLSYDYAQLFEVNKKALSGTNGLYTHNSYRKDKVDAYPCPRLIEMLKGL
ncbi:N-acetylmuramoyl-L-alanine amidase [compost metagenome]